MLHRAPRKRLAGKGRKPEAAREITPLGHAIRARQIVQIAQCWWRHGSVDGDQRKSGSILHPRLIIQVPMGTSFCSGGHAVPLYPFAGKDILKSTAGNKRLRMEFVGKLLT